MARVSIGTCIWDGQTRKLLRGGSDIPLTALEESLLAYLAEHQGRTVPRDELLREVWGYAPTVRTRAVANVVSRLRSKLGEDGARLATVFSRGYRLEVTTDDGLVGRDGLLDHVRDLLDRHRMVTLHGVGGVGKSRVAQALVHGPWHRMWVPAAGLQTRSELLAAVAGVAELDEGPTELAVELALKGFGSALLVIDAAEHLDLDAIQLLAGWRRLTDQLFIVVTSRVEHGQGAHVAVPPLQPKDAARLFTRRATEARPQSQLDPTLVDATVAHLDGLPLAVEIAAARLRLMDLPALQERLRADGLRALAGGRLESVLQHTWELLAPDRRHALTAAAQFPERFTIDQLGDLLQLETSATMDALDDLVRASLVVGRHPRFGLLDVVRDFAARRASEATTQAFCAWAARAAQAVHQRVASGDWVSSEELAANAPAFRRALGLSPGPEAHAWLALGIFAHDQRLGPVMRMESTLLAAHQAPLPAELAIDVRHALAVSFMASSTPDEALVYLQEAMALAAAGGLPRQQLGLRASLLEAQLYATEGRDLLDDARELAAEAGRHPQFPALQASAYLLVARTHVFGGEVDTAVGLYLRAQERAGDRIDLKVHAKRGLGGVYRVKGQLDAAIHILEEAHAEAEAHALGEIELQTAIRLGDMYDAKGDEEGVRRLYAKVEKLGETLGNLSAILAARGYFADQETDPEKAEAMLQLVRDQAEAYSRFEDMALADLNLGIKRHFRGELREAEEAYRSCAHLLRDRGWIMIGTMARVWAELAHAEQGDATSAQAALANLEPPGDLERQVVEIARAAVRSDRATVDRYDREGPPDIVFRHTVDFCRRLVD